MRTFLYSVTFTVGAVVLTAPVPAPHTPTPPAPHQTVVSTWYQLTGNLTASGERMRHGEETVAHHTLPFGTRVALRNPATGTTTIARVTDRGPWLVLRSGRRIPHPIRKLDVSLAVAQKLGFRSQGVANLIVTPLTESLDKGITVS